MLNVMTSDIDVSRHKPTLTMTVQKIALGVFIWLDSLLTVKKSALTSRNRGRFSIIIFCKKQVIV